MNNNFDLIASVRLPKGKYLFTLSFLVNTTNSVMYLSLSAEIAAGVPKRSYSPAHKIVICANNPEENFCSGE